MAKQTYIGIGGVARKVKKQYLGVGGVARTVKKGYLGVNGVARQCFAGGTPLSSLAVGTVVQVKESGTAVNYIIVHQGLPSSLYDASCNGTWLLRQSVSSQTLFGSRNPYADSALNSYCNSSIFSTFSTTLQSAIKQVKIPYTAGLSSSTVYTGANGLSVKVFSLSSYEIINSGSGVDGTILSYFSNGGSVRASVPYGEYFYWTRSAVSSNSVYVYRIEAAEGVLNGSGRSEYVQGVRPAFILPGDFTVEELAAA